MDKNTQAKNGFKTFVVTLSVSLVIFSAIYYFVTDYSSDVDIENYDDSIGANVKGDSDSKETVFGTINAGDANPVDTSKTAPRVLAEEDTIETTESTVPDTGSGTLVGTILGVGSLAAAGYAILVGPRNLAMAGFENKVLRGLDDEE